MTEESKPGPAFPVPPNVSKAVVHPESADHSAATVASASLPDVSRQETIRASAAAMSAPRPTSSANDTTKPVRWLMVLAAALLGLVIGVIVTTVVRKPPIDETRFVNFDAASRSLLGAGFSNPEGSGDDAFAWCSAKTCKVTLYSRGEVDRTIAFQIAPYSFPNAPQQSVTVLLNGTPLGIHKLPGGVSVVRARAPKSAWRPGPNELRFDFGYAEAPKEHVPGNADPRKLAAAFVWIAMTGPAAPAASASSASR